MSDPVVGVPEPPDWLTDDPCPHCGGSEWVEDKNWQPEYAGQERVEHNGLIPCGACG